MGMASTGQRICRSRAGEGIEVSLAASMIGSIDWSHVDVLRGSGSDLADALSRFIECDDPSRMSELWWGLEGVMFAQNTVYGGCPSVAHNSAG
jgi:hypothetical protein